MLSRKTLFMAVSALALGAGGAVAEEAETVVLDEVSVTATREERLTKSVPQSISVIGQEKIEANTMMNVKDAVSGTPGVLIDSRNGGYDARLVLRGAGLKARYGVREIMVLRDGVPMTDPDSFTRLDFIDTQDIEQIEIVKGPGSIYATGSAGGTIQILSKPVFEQDNRLKVGGGTEGTATAHARVGGFITENQALALSASWRHTENDWRRWNEFDTKQIGLKHGVFVGDGGVIESEVSYSEADLQLPGSMDETMYLEFERTGSQEETSSPWKHSARNSKILFGNVRYEQEFGAFTFKPRIYATKWEHFHPVTGFINDSEGNYVYGTDIEGVYKHDLFTAPSSLVAGVTFRQDRTEDAKKYTYRDTQTRLVVPRFGAPYRQILATLSDARGQLAEVEDATNTVVGVFAQENIQLTPTVMVDVGFRLDHSTFDIETNELIGFNYGRTTYEAGDGRSTTDAEFLLFSPKIGVSWAVTPQVNVYGNVARAGQVPSASELGSNAGLDAAESTQYEIGVKARYRQLRLDAAAYYNPVENEIVSQRSNGETVYMNAGETSKRGIEISAAWIPVEGLTLGGGYAFSDYEFEEFSEVVFGGGPPRNVSRNGNQLPFIPRHQYSLFADYEHESGFRFRVQTESWGEYFMDNANTEKYEGYDFVTDVMVGWEWGPHLLALNVENLFDQHYASEVTKDTSGEKDYYAAMPRLVMATYRLKF